MDDSFACIVVGTGFASSFFLHEYLRGAGSEDRVLVLEKGPRRDHAERAGLLREPDSRQDFDPTEGHILGTAVMGSDPAYRMLRGPSRSQRDARRPVSDPAAGREELIAYLEQRLPGLRLDAAVLAAFADDFFAPPGPSSHRPAELTPEKRFLLSTDFFQEGASPYRALHYVAFYDPYRSPCCNPLRRPPAPPPPVPG